MSAADRRPGRIVGEPEPSVWHPTWRMTYHA